MNSAFDERERTGLVAELLPGPASAAQLRIAPIEGGRNNRVFRVDGAGPPLLLKSYFSHASDKRDRFAAERAFYDFLAACDDASAPKAVAWDANSRLGLFTFVNGRKLERDEVGAEAIGQAMRFIAAANACRGTAQARALGDASEACFSVSDHLSLVGARVRRLEAIPGRDAVDVDAASFVADRLVPRWEAVRESVTRACEEAGISAESHLPPAERCISPSDFGFHNAIRRDDGTLVFFDFEYAGWDDPAKLASDFFCQQQKPVSLDFRNEVLSRLSAISGNPEAFRVRAALLLGVYQVKWCCIILNDFLAADSARRSFADATLPAEDRKVRQLAAAHRLLEKIQLPSIASAATKN